MEKRKELNKFVMIVINGCGSEPPCAREIYEKIKDDNPQIIREEKVRGFKSFVKILNSFKEIKPVGTRGSPLAYKLKKNI
jgi:hypothetical protein